MVGAKGFEPCIRKKPFLSYAPEKGFKQVIILDIASSFDIMHLSAVEKIFFERLFGNI